MLDACCLLMDCIGAGAHKYPMALDSSALGAISRLSATVGSYSLGWFDLRSVWSRSPDVGWNEDPQFLTDIIIEP